MSRIYFIASEKGNAKFALGGIFSHASKEPANAASNREITEYEDGTTISYDTKNSTLEINKPKRDKYNG